MVELLKRQIESAERSLLSNSAPAMNQQDSSASPTGQAAKRRHTAAFASEGNPSPEKSAKRTKSLKTYGASRRQPEPADDGNFDHFRNDEAPKATTSQSARFSVHSGHQSSLPLPAGSLQTDFLNHEPAVMFKDTGDTVADASSEQQRLLNHVLASKNGLSTSLTKEPQQAMEQQSSSIPWTASDTADSAKSKRSEQKTNADEEAGDYADELTGVHNLPDNDTSAGAEKRLPDESEDTQSAASHSLKIAKQDEFSLRRPKSSPKVEIPRQEPQKAVANEGGTQTAPKASKGRKRKVEGESFEPLNSDDRAIGLPKECYQPRPSRRRATQVIEEPVDYSIRPEKAAKVKRTKSTGSKPTIAADEDELEAFQGMKGGASPSNLGEEDQVVDPRKEPVSTEAKANAALSESDESSIKPRRTIKQSDVEEPKSETPAREPKDCPNESKAMAEEDEDKIFVKPAIPTPKPKCSSRAKRAQTTIFEDHVEFMGSRKSPNLSQQQAKRKSALQDVENEAVPKPQRKRKTVVAEDSDDEDELAKENNVVAARAKSPPKKRRGRPPKSDKQVQNKATNSVLEDADEEEEGAAPAEEEEYEGEERPKKRGRGRPSKFESKANSEDTNAASAAKESNDEATEPSHNDETMQPASQPESTPSKPSAPAAEMPTPSPEKPTEKAKSTPQKATSTTTQQHSPIKSSSKVPFRVGLSKRHRIPSLLRMTKPPKR